MKALYQQGFHEIIVKDWEGTNNVISPEIAQTLIEQLKVAIEEYQADSICRECDGRGFVLAGNVDSEDDPLRREQCSVCGGVGKIEVSRQ